jgi:pilus assembly protein CpaC
MSAALLRRTIASPLTLASLVLLAAAPAHAFQALPGRQPMITKIDSATERIEMTVNTSRILTLDQRIPQVQVNNPALLGAEPVAANQIQIFARKAGVTQLNFWTEDDQVSTVDVIIYGDAQELSMILAGEFPTSAVRVKPLSQSVIISGVVDDPSHVSRIVQIAEDYYPKVINQLSVGGVQQVMLRVKVFEVSRTKLRQLGIDFAAFNGDDSFISSISGLISATAGNVRTAGDSIAFGVVDGSSSFFGAIDALRQNNLMKILAEPDLVTVSGRAASFNAGGEFPILVPQSLGTVSIEYKRFGTQVDFVPIVLGNGMIRLEVKPRVSEIDNTRSVTINNTTIPGLRVREVDTGVEMRAGQTLALAGLLQTRTEAENRGIPWVSDLPIIGSAFRRVQHTDNEIELLILVTPEFVEPMDPHEVPACMPGTTTASPNDWELYMRGYMEVPKCGPRDMAPGSHPEEGMPVGEESLPEGDTVRPLPPPAGGSGGASARPPSSGLPGESRARAVSYGPRSSDRNNPQPRQPSPGSRPSSSRKSAPGMIGPVGYDLNN